MAVIKRQTITAQVIDYILDLIRTGRVKPGEQLPTTLAGPAGARGSRPGRSRGHGDGEGSVRGHHAAAHAREGSGDTSALPGTMGNAS